jgi:hypothetical protein
MSFAPVSTLLDGNLATFCFLINGNVRLVHHGSSDYPGLGKCSRKHLHYNMDELSGRSYKYYYWNHGERRRNCQRDERGFGHGD